MRSLSLGPLRISFILFVLIVVVGCGGGDGATSPDTTEPLQFEHYDTGFFSIDKPVGWTVTLAGRCSDFAFLV